MQNPTRYARAMNRWYELRTDPVIQEIDDTARRREPSLDKQARMPPPPDLSLVVSGF